MAYRYTDFQLLLHTLPEGISRFLGGGRGGSKSVGIAQDISIVARKYGPDAKMLYIRQGPYKALNDFIDTISKIFTMLWGPKAHSLNRGSHTWTLPTGSYLELGILPDGELGRKYYEKTYQGRSFTHIWIDEAQQWAMIELLDLLVSNLRGVDSEGRAIPTRQTIAANPGGIGHQALAARFVNTGVRPWEVFPIKQEVRKQDGTIEVHERKWMCCPSTYRDNPFNGDDYLANLAQSCHHDEELLQAWIDGNWNISRGAYFAGVLQNQRIKVNWPYPRDWQGWSPRDWEWWLAFDHGTTSPAVCYVMAGSPGALGPDRKYYPAGSVVMVDEWACHRPGDYSKAFGWTVPVIAGHVRGLAERWEIDADGVADDACFGETGHELTIAGEYALAGVVWRPASKGHRAPRFQTMKRLLAAAGRGDEPGLFVDERNVYWWNTVPFIVIDPKDREVPLKCETDHGLDASSYGISGSESHAGVIRGVR